MITIYSEKEPLQNHNAGEYLEQQSQRESSRLTRDDINREIQSNLKSFDSIDWSKPKECK